MADLLDAYKVLQVDAEAEGEVVQAAYRRLARKYHPDHAAGEEAAGRMAAINAAWELIGKPDARAAYDRARALSDAQPPRADGQAPRAGSARVSSAQAPGAPPTVGPRYPPDTVSRDWTSGRSSQGGGFDTSMRAADGLGAAGPPPGRPSGSVLNFGRYGGWSLGEIGRRDLEYLEWLDRMPIGRSYREEVDAILRASGRRRSAGTESTERRGLFRRR
jgi:curved DNA-binding protein CbpA